MPAVLMRAAIDARFDLVVSPAILAEFARVFADRHGASPEHVRRAVVEVGTVGAVVRPHRRLTVLADDADNRILECAVEGEVDTIVSGDRHLLDLGQYEGIEIVTVREALARLGVEEGQR